MATRKLLLENETKSNYDLEAKKLGATHLRLFHLQKYVYGVGMIPVLFSTHYFNRFGLEISYTIEDMKSICGMTILDEPREWSERFKTHKDYTLVKEF